VFDFDALGAVAIDAFGARVRLRRGGGAPATVPAVFDRHHATLPLGGDVAGVAALRAQITLRPAAVPGGVLQGDKAEVALLNGVQVDIAAPPAGAVVEAFAVTEIRPDGFGGALLLLQEWED
jgi:hypothetical protein